MIKNNRNVKAFQWYVGQNRKMVSDYCNVITLIMINENSCEGVTFEGMIYKYLGRIASMLSV